MPGALWGTLAARLTFVVEALRETMMMPDPLAEGRVIDVVVQSAEDGFIVATSRQLPKLLAVATC